MIVVFQTNPLTELLRPHVEAIKVLGCPGEPSCAGNHQPIPLALRLPEQPWRRRFVSSCVR
jgi:hypothetical protein